MKDNIYQLLVTTLAEAIKATYWASVAFVPVAIAINTLQPITGLPRINLSQSLALCFLVKVTHLTFESKTK